MATQSEINSINRLISQFKYLPEAKLLEIHAFNLTKDWKNGRIALGKPKLSKKSTLGQLRLVDEYLKLLQKPTIEKVKIVYGITGITLTSSFAQNLTVMGNRKIGGGLPNISVILGIFITQATYNRNSGIWKAIILLSLGTQKEFNRILKQLQYTINKNFKIINKYVSNVRISVKYQLYGGVQQWSSTAWEPLSGYSIPNWLLTHIGVDFTYLQNSQTTNSTGVIEKILKVEITWK